jgi:hypothetical protein
MTATQNWRNAEEATIRGLPADQRRRRPGVTFDVEEDPPEAELENRAKMRSNSFSRRRRPSQTNETS